MITDYCVNYKIACKLKELGYPQNNNDDFYWMLAKDNDNRSSLVSFVMYKMYSDLKYDDIVFIAAPNYLEVLDWLETTYNIRIVIRYRPYGKIGWYYIINGIFYDTISYSVKKQVLDKAIPEALKLI